MKALRELRKRDTAGRVHVSVGSVCKWGRMCDGSEGALSASCSSAQ